MFRKRSREVIENAYNEYKNQTKQMISRHNRRWSAKQNEVCVYIWVRLILVCNVCLFLTILADNTEGNLAENESQTNCGGNNNVAFYYYYHNHSSLSKSSI